MGRMQIYKTFILSLIFPIFWNVNYFLNLHLVGNSPDGKLFDDYAVSLVYVFGGAFGLILALDVRSFLVKSTHLHKQK